MRDLHVALGWVVIIANALVGAWALAAHRVEVLRGRPLWIATAMAQVGIAVQLIIGVAYQNSADIEASGVHLFYGFVALSVVGIIYSYRDRMSPWLYLMYGGTGLFLAGMLLRAAFNAALGSGL